MSLSRPQTRHGGMGAVSCVWLLNLGVSSFDALDFWSTDAFFDGMGGETDATNMLVQRVILLPN